MTQAFARLFSGLALAVSAFASVPAHAECTCRYQGGDVIEGGVACIGTGNNMTLARCEKVLNNTSWKMLNQPCPSAMLSGEFSRLASVEMAQTPGTSLPKP